MKLEINNSYSLYTTSDYISNKKVKILGFINYDRASQYKSFVENIAINEKFIDTVEDTQTYLKSLIYYDCGEIEYTNGEWVLTGNHVIVWDDIIDTERTARLYEQYVYKLAFNFKDLSSTDSITKYDVIEVIKNAINSTYNTNKQKVGLEITAVSDSSIDSVETQLEKTTEMLTKANETLNSFINLQDKADSIASSFTDNNILDKVNTIGTNITTIMSTTETILENTK